MKSKIKEIIERFIKYTLIYEFKNMIVITLVMLCVGIFGLLLITNHLNNELINIALKQKEEYIILENKYDTLNEDYNRLKMWNEEIYDLLGQYQENKDMDKQCFSKHNNFFGKIEVESYD